MNKLPKDIVILIGMSLDLKSITNLSLSCKKYNDILCNNEIFWMNRLGKDYGKYGHVPSIVRNKKGGMTWKKYYRKLNMDVPKW